MKINILDLFSGIGGFSKGFIDAGFEIENHYFSEIDLHAIANYKYNFKHSQYVGTVEHVFRGGIERPHVITFGSPCQDFSLAGKRKGLDGDRSSLIEHAITAISHFRPDVFVWENVKGAFSSNNGEDFWAIIQAFANIGGYTIEWQLLNTAWLLPQNRERIYLIGHLAASKRNWRKVFPIGENDSFTRKANEAERDWVQAKHCSTIGLNYGNRPTDTFIECEDIAGTLIGGGNSGGPHSDMTVIGSMQANSAVRNDGICTTLTSAMGIGGGHIPMVSNYIQLDASGKGHNSQQDRVFFENGQMGTIPAGRTDAKVNILTNEMKLRRLTEIECERLQGFKDDWTKYGLYPMQKVSQRQFNELSNEDKIKSFEETELKEIAATQRYKMLGNAVTRDVVELIARNLYETTTQ